jgi:hypothetical protein
MLGPMHGATRCGAKTRRGTACQSPAVRGKRRCRMHGGAPGSGAPSGRRNGNYRHGHFTADAPISFCPLPPAIFAFLPAA